MTPERTPHITLVSRVSSESGEEWEADCNCEQAAFDIMHQEVSCSLSVQCFTEAQLQLQLKWALRMKNVFMHV